MAVENSMNLGSNHLVRYLIMLVAVVNIAAMMVFQYWLPAEASGKNKESEEYAVTEDDRVGTIESVERETEAKEAEEAQTALAREEEPEEPEEERDPDAPILELTDDHIYLKVGERFLSHYIYLDKYVDTSEPGEIELTYRITSVITGKSDSKVLLITIQE